MIPCQRNDCMEWIDPTTGVYCAKHTRVERKRKPTRAYDALPEQVRGIGIVTTRRILVHRPKSVRRSMPVNAFTDWSYSMQRDSDELSRRVPRESRDKSSKTVAEARADRRAQTIKLLGIVGTLGEGDRD